MDIDVADDVRAAVRRQQPVDQRLQSIRLFDDDLRVFAQFLQLPLGQFQFEQLRGAAYAA
jgi:hypothetical protein